MDAAYAGVSAMLPECARHFEGVELVHSFNTNPHKWLLTNFDSSALFVRDAGPLKQALTLNPSFLQNKTNEYDYKVTAAVPFEASVERGELMKLASEV